MVHMTIDNNKYRNQIIRGASHVGGCVDVLALVEERVDDGDVALHRGRVNPPRAILWGPKAPLRLLVQHCSSSRLEKV